MEAFTDTLPIVCNGFKLDQVISFFLFADLNVFVANVKKHPVKYKSDCRSFLHAHLIFFV